MRIKLLVIFLIAMLIAFIVLPIRMDNIGGGGPRPLDELSITKEYVWLGGLKLIKEAHDYGFNNIMQWPSQEGYQEELILLTVESIAVGAIFTALIYFFSKKSKRLHLR